MRAVPYTPACWSGSGRAAPACGRAAAQQFLDRAGHAATTAALPEIGEATQQALLGDDFSITNALIVVTSLVGVDFALDAMKRRFPSNEGDRSRSFPSSSRCQPFGH
jgi:hypothetical protein